MFYHSILFLSFFLDDPQNKSVIVSLDGIESELELLEFSSIEEKVIDLYQS